MGNQSRVRSATRGEHHNCLATLCVLCLLRRPVVFHLPRLPTLLRNVPLNTQLHCGVLQAFHKVQHEPDLCGGELNHLGPPRPHIKTPPKRHFRVADSGRRGRSQRRRRPQKFNMSNLSVPEILATPYHAPVTPMLRSCNDSSYFQTCNDWRERVDKERRRCYIGFSGKEIVMSSRRMAWGTGPNTQ